MKNIKKKVFFLLKLLIILFVIFLLIMFGINSYVKFSVHSKIIGVSQVEHIDPDCILILGAAVRPDKTPSPMLEDRLKKGIEIYNKYKINRILMSGDNRSKDYDEVDVMKQYAIDKGVPARHIFTDPAGLSTYESIYRAKKLFGSKKVVIVTQQYHLYRALYIAKKLDLDAYGVPTMKKDYTNQQSRNIREVLARIKDFLVTFIDPMAPVDESTTINSDLPEIPEE